MTFDRRLIEAKITLDQIGFHEFPALAADALEAGFDGPAIRRMAAMVLPTGLEIDELRPQFQHEAGLVTVSPATASVRLATQRANEILDGDLDPLCHLGRFERWFLDAECPYELRELGLLEEDAYVLEYSGKSEGEIGSWALERLRAFVLANRPDSPVD